MTRVLVAGATGAVGTEVVKLLRDRGRRIRTLSRDPGRAERLRGLTDDILTGDAIDARTLDGTMDGVDAVISCLGAAATVGGRERRSYRAVDTVANLNLLDAARAAGVKRFVYVSVHVEPGYARTAYVKAHEEVIAALRASGLEVGIVRPTGIFTALEAYVGMARRGLIVVPGRGDARTNPVHAADVAEVCVEMLDGAGGEVSVGGPDVLRRDDIARLSFEAVGRKPRLLHLPAWMFLAGAALIAPFHRRLGQLFSFATRVSTSNCVAPTRGKRRLRDHFLAVAGPSAPRELTA